MSCTTHYGLEHFPALLEAHDRAQALAKLNFIFFDDASQFEQSADKLAEALNTDIGWIRQHTEYGEAERRRDDNRGRRRDPPPIPVVDARRRLIDRIGGNRRGWTD